MRYLEILLIIVGLLTSCWTPSSETPLLAVSNMVECNQISDLATINGVNLIGYEFANLIIGVGESVTLSLDEGMPSGLDGITIQVEGEYGIGNQINQTIEVDFQAGEVTKIKLVATDTACELKGTILKLDE